MSEGITCYERDETLCEDGMCFRTGCQLRNARLNADNAKELLALAAQIAAPHGPRSFLTQAERNVVIDALRLSARQQASVEEVARSLCKADGTAQCAAICLSYSSTSTTNGKCPEAKRIWGHKCRALLAKYDIFEKVSRP